MLHKILIVILFVGVLLSLSSGLYFLLKDFNESKKMRYALSIRLLLASLLIAVMVHGFYSGALSPTAPWDSRIHAKQSDVKGE